MKDEWVESVGGTRRPDAPRYPAVPSAPGKRGGGRKRKAPKGEGRDVRARLTPEAIQALEHLEKMGMTATEAVNAALILAAKP